MTMSYSKMGSSARVKPAEAYSVKAVQIAKISREGKIYGSKIYSNGNALIRRLREGYRCSNHIISEEVSNYIPQEPSYRRRSAMTDIFHVSQVGA